MSYVKNMYTYSTYAIFQKSRKYLSFVEEAESFVGALTSFFLSSPELISSVCSLYCRKPVSGDLQLMGEYDGLSVYMEKGERHSHILTMSNGRTYAWNGKMFVRDNLNFAVYQDI